MLFFLKTELGGTYHSMIHIFTYIWQFSYDSGLSVFIICNELYKNGPHSGCFIPTTTIMNFGQELFSL